MNFIYNLFVRFSIFISGCFLRHLTSPSGADFCRKITHIIIDEVHDREMKTDFLLLLLKDILTNHWINIVLMSATMDCEIFKRYFDDCNIIQIPGRRHVVDILYLDEVIAQTHYRERTIEKDIEDQFNDDEIDQNLLCHLIQNIHQNSPANESILVFLPGLDAISEQESMLKQLSDMKNYRTIILHSEVTDDKDQEIAFDVAGSMERKIILATNIAETSITIPDLVCILISSIYNIAPRHCKCLCTNLHIYIYFIIFILNFNRYM